MVMVRYSYRVHTVIIGMQTVIAVNIKPVMQTIITIFPIVCLFHVFAITTAKKKLVFMPTLVFLFLYLKNAPILVWEAISPTRYQQTTLSVSGIAGKNDQVNYTLTATNQSGGNNLVGGNVSYQLPSSTLSGSYTEANNYRQTGLGAKGTLVAIPGHIVFSGETGQTYTIIDAPMASDMMVNADKTTLTNQQGVVLVANSTPYRTNTYTLTDTEKTAGAEVLGNMANVSPYQGAVNYIKLETDTRQTYIIRGALANGDSLPLEQKSQMLNNRVLVMSANLA